MYIYIYIYIYIYDVMRIWPESRIYGENNPLSINLKF